MSRKTRRQNSPSALPARQATQLRSVQFGWEGPLPPPAILRGYEDIFPGCAERIVSAMERQSAHRQALETRAVKSNAWSEKLGTMFGFIIVLSSIGGGFYLILNDKNVYGMAAIISALVALVGVFIYGKRSQAAERERKLKQARG
jgi:uncharacterized membrane protein